MCPVIQGHSVTVEAVDARIRRVGNPERETGLLVGAATAGEVRLNPEGPVGDWVCDHPRAQGGLFVFFLYFCLFVCLFSPQQPAEL